MFQRLCQPVIIPATSLPPHCLHRCVQNTDFFFFFIFGSPSTAALSLPLSTLSLSRSCSYTHNTPYAVSQTQKRSLESVHCCSWWNPPAQGLFFLFFFLNLYLPSRTLLSCYQTNWSLLAGACGNLCRQVKKKNCVCVCVWSNKWVFCLLYEHITGTIQWITEHCSALWRFLVNVFIKYYENIYACISRMYESVALSH